MVWEILNKKQNRGTIERWIEKEREKWVGKQMSVTEKINTS